MFYMILIRIIHTEEGDNTVQLFIKSILFFHQEKKTLVHIPTKKCLDREDVANSEFIKISECTGADSQQWLFENYLL